MCGIKSQVERSCGLKAESAVVGRQLIRGQPDIQQDSVNKVDPQFIKHGSQPGVAGMDELAIGSIQLLRSEAQHVWIAVQANQPAVRPDSLEDLQAVAARSDRPIHDGESWLQLEML